MLKEKEDLLTCISSIEGDLKRIRKMMQKDTYCLTVLRQAYTVRKAIEKLEATILEKHLHTCVPELMTSGKVDAMIEELVQLYNLVGNR